MDVETLYRNYGPMVMRRCRSILADEEEAKDALQDTFVRVLRYRDRLTDRAPSSLLYTMATNVCLNRLRSSRQARIVPVGDDTEALLAEHDGNDRILDRVLAEKILGTLDEATRETALDRYVRGKTLCETATCRGLSVSGVRKRLNTVTAHARRVNAA